MVLERFKRPKREAEVADRLYRSIVERARDPVFFAYFNVPDTLDGRFDLIALHSFLVMDALKSQGQACAEIGTLLANLIFAGFDQALRDLGVSDFGLSRRIKAMADAFYGRLEAYRAAGEDGAALAAAVGRNLYRGENERPEETEALARYVISAKRGLAVADLQVAGSADFGPLPERPHHSKGT